MRYLPAIAVLSRLSKTGHSGDLFAGESLERTIVVDSPPDPLRIRPFGAAWEYHVHRLAHYPLRDTAASPFELKFSPLIVRDWRVLPSGEGVELMLAQQSPLPVHAVAGALESWNGTREDTTVRILRSNRIVVKSRRNPPWVLFPVLLESNGQTGGHGSGIRVEQLSDGPEVRWRLGFSTGNAVVLDYAPERFEQCVGNPDALLVGSTAKATRLLLEKREDTVLLKNLPPRIGTVIVNPEAIPDRNERRAILSLASSGSVHIARLLPMYEPTNLLIPGGVSSRTAHLAPSAAVPQTGESRNRAELLLPDRDGELAEVFERLFSTRQPEPWLQLKVLPVEVWASRVCAGQFTVAYWEFDWRYGEWTVLDAFRLDAKPRPGVPRVPVDDPTIQALLNLLYAARSPRDWRAAVQELNRRLVSEGYVLPLWRVPELARVPRNLVEAGEIRTMQDVFQPA